MNRLALLDENTAAIPPTGYNPNASITTSVREALPRTGDLTRHATFAPMHYEPRYAYPLVIWLHGAQGNERQLRAVMPLVSMRNYVAFAPRGTAADGSVEGAFSWKQSAAHIEEAERRVLECIAAAERRFHIHAQRVFLAGYGCGGTMAVRLAWNRPDRFTGAATIGGPLPIGQRPLRRLNELRELPLLISTGQHSQIYAERQVCRDLRLLHSAGLGVSLRQYPCGDEIRTNMLSDLNAWIMDIVCNPDSK
jgi:phospholipase/carboxylesterase